MARGVRVWLEGKYKGDLCGDRIVSNPGCNSERKWHRTIQILYYCQF